MIPMTQEQRTTPIAFGLTSIEAVARVGAERARLRVWLARQALAALAQSALG